MFSQHFLVCFQMAYSSIFVIFVCSEIKLEEAAILHYTYTKFSDLTSRRDRCGCKPTKEDVKRCFILEFDRLVSYLFTPLLYHTASIVVLHSYVYWLPCQHHSCFVAEMLN
jgi:hypothetical protein